MLAHCMNLTRKITIKSVRERVLIVKRANSTLVRQCPECPIGNMMVSADGAAELSEHSLRAICRLVEANEVHYRESRDGLFICLSSLPDVDPTL
jgi:hypothetical protein